MLAGLQDYRHGRSPLDVDRGSIEFERLNQFAGAQFRSLVVCIDAKSASIAPVGANAGERQDPPLKHATP